MAILASVVLAVPLLVLCFGVVRHARLTGFDKALGIVAALFLFVLVGGKNGVFQPFGIEPERVLYAVVVCGMGVVFFQMFHDRITRA
jgi:hypothetical protein